MNEQDIKELFVDITMKWYGDLREDFKPLMKEVINKIAPMAVNYALRASRGDPIAARLLEHVEQQAKNEGAIFLEHQALKTKNSLEKGVVAVAKLIGELVMRALK